MDDSGEDRKYAIVVEGYEEPVGFTALYGLFRQTAPELGALIGDDVRGKGVGRRAEALTIAKAFDEFGAHRVYGRIPARNEVAKKTVDQPRLGARGDDARPPRAATASRPTTARSGASSPTSSAPPPRTCSGERPAATAELIADRGEAAASAEFFRSRPFLDAEGVTHTLRIEAGDAELLAPLIVRAIGDGRRARRRLPLRLPGLGRAVEAAVRRPRSRPRIDFSATGLVSVFIRHRLGPPPLSRRHASATSSRSPTRRCRRRAGPATAARSARTSRRATSCALVPGPETTPEQRAGFLDRLRADDAPHRRRPALLLRRRLLRPRARSRPHLARPRHRPRRRPRRRLDRRRQRRLPPLLPLRQRRLAPARLADEERRRPPGRALRRARPPAQPRRRHLPRRRPGGVQARLRQPHRSLADLRDRLRPGQVPPADAEAATPGPSSLPTAPSSVPRASAP